MEAKVVTWFKVDDGLHSHPKAIEAGAAAMGLWVLAGSWCADQLTDGFIPAYMAARLVSEDGPMLAARLVTVGLWEPAHTDDGRMGWRFHDWEDMQPSRQQVRDDRKASAERQRAYRERRKNARNGVTHGVTNAVTDGATRAVTNAAPTRPDPTTTRSVVVGGAGVRTDDRGRLPASTINEEISSPEKPMRREDMPGFQAYLAAKAKLRPGSPEKLTGSGVKAQIDDARRRAERDAARNRVFDDTNSASNTSANATHDGEADNGETRTLDSSNGRATQPRRLQEPDGVQAVPAHDRAGPGEGVADKSDGPVPRKS